MRLLAAVSIVACLGACMRGSGVVTYELANLEISCARAPTGPSSLCSVGADVKTRFPADTLAVIAVTQGGQDVSKNVVFVSNGVGRFDRKGVEIRNMEPALGARVVGFVGTPVDDTLTIVNGTITCAPSSGTRPDQAGNETGSVACRATGHVRSSRPESWRVAVEVRILGAELSPSTFAMWTIVKLENGDAPFSMAWTSPVGATGASFHLRAAGIVVKAPGS